MNAGARPRFSPCVSLAFARCQEARGAVCTAGRAHWGVPTGRPRKVYRTQGLFVGSLGICKRRARWRTALDASEKHFPA